MFNIQVIFPVSLLLASDLPSGFGKISFSKETKKIKFDQHIFLILANWRTFFRDSQFIMFKDKMMAFDYIEICPTLHSAHCLQRTEHR